MYISTDCAVCTSLESAAIKNRLLISSLVHFALIS